MTLNNIENPENCNMMEHRAPVLRVLRAIFKARSSSRVLEVEGRRSFVFRVPPHSPGNIKPE